MGFLKFLVYLEHKYPIKSFVDIIHTDEKLGLQTQIGHMDFWPNGGKQQPGKHLEILLLKHLKLILLKFNKQGCTIAVLFTGLIDFIGCAHMRAIYLYISSIVSSNYFVSSNNCTSYSEI